MAEENGNVLDDKHAAIEKAKEDFEEVMLAVINHMSRQTEVYFEGKDHARRPVKITKKDNIYILNFEDITFASYDSEFRYFQQNIDDLEEGLEQKYKDRPDGVPVFQYLGLPDLKAFAELQMEQIKAKDQRLERGPHIETKQEGEKTEQDPDKGNEEETLQTIASQLGIDPQKVFPIRRDSDFYKNHPGFFKDKTSFFYEDPNGVYRVGKINEKGKAVEDSESFKPNPVKKMKPVLKMGDGREDVTIQIPIQTIQMNNPAQGSGEQDVQNRYIAIFKERGGHPEFYEVAQPREESQNLIGTRIEVSGKRYNTKGANKERDNVHGELTLSQIARIYETLRDTEKAKDGLQPTEVFGTLVEIIDNDLKKARGPMPEEQLIDLRNNVLDNLGNGMDYDSAIANALKIERDPGGRTPADGALDPRNG